MWDYLKLLCSTIRCVNQLANVIKRNLINHFTGFQYVLEFKWGYSVLFEFKNVFTNQQTEKYLEKRGNFRFIQKLVN